MERLLDRLNRVTKTDVLKKGASLTGTEKKY
jgi:hypothetical protein